MRCQSTFEKQHLLFDNTKLFSCSCSALEVISTFALLIFSDDIIALLVVYVSVSV